MTLRSKLHAKDSKAEKPGILGLCWATKAPVDLPSGFFLYQRENSMCLVWVSVTNSPSQFLTLHPQPIFYFLPHKFASFQIFPVSVTFLCFSWNMSSMSLPLGFEVAVHSWLGLSSPKNPFGSLLHISVQMPTYQQGLPRAFFLKLHSFLHYTFPYPELFFLALINIWYIIICSFVDFLSPLWLKCKIHESNDFVFLITAIFDI